MITKFLKQLPVIQGKPFVPKRNIKPHLRLDKDYVCRDAECRRGDRAGNGHTHPNPIQGGSGWLDRKADGTIVYHTPWIKPPRPFVMKEIKSRIETTAAAFKRMTKELTAALVKSDWLTEKDKQSVHSMTGRACGPDGDYRIVATNGHWALIERGPATVKGPAATYIGRSNAHTEVVVNDPELYLAVVRAMIMAGESRHAAVNLVADAERQLLTVYAVAKDGKDVLGDFTQSIPCYVERSWHIAVNGAYLLPCLGVWPLRLWVADDERILIAEPACSSWQYAVMPLRETWDELPEPFVG